VHVQLLEYICNTASGVVTGGQGAVLLSAHKYWTVRNLSKNFLFTTAKFRAGKPTYCQCSGTRSNFGAPCRKFSAACQKMATSCSGYFLTFPWCHWIQCTVEWNAAKSADNFCQFKMGHRSRGWTTWCL